MDLKQLRHFICVVDTGSFSQAALELSLTQSALTRSVQALEQSLGAQLLQRVSKRSEPTALGRVVYARGRRVVFEAGEIEQDLVRLRELALGTLRVGLGPWPSALLTAPMLQHVARHFPGLRLHLSRGPIASQLLDLRERRLDALLMDPRSIESPLGLNVEKATDFRVGFFCRPQHPLATSARPVNFAALLPYPIACSPISAEGARALIDQYGEQAAPSRLLSISCEEWNGMMELTRDSDTVHLGSIALAHRQVKTGELVELPVTPKPKGVVRIALATLARRTEAPALAVLREFVNRHLHETSRAVKA